MMKILLTAVTLSGFGLASDLGTKRTVAFTPNAGPACELVCRYTRPYDICPSSCKQTQEGCVDKKTNKFCSATAGGYNSCYVNGPCSYGSRGCLDDETGASDGLSPGSHVGHCPSAEQLAKWEQQDDKRREFIQRIQAENRCFGCWDRFESNCISNGNEFEDKVQCFRGNCSLSCAYYLTFACEKCRDEDVGAICKNLQPDPKLRPQCAEEQCRPFCDEKLFWIEFVKASEKA